MQDRYAGDVGDFGKLSMLRQIANTGMKVGVNWYRTYKPEEYFNEDGKHIGYLNNKSFVGCDDELLESLREVINSNRSIAALEASELIPNARYYSAILKPGSDHSFSRDFWYQNSLEVLSDCDIIFCDPDNGLLGKSVSLTSKKSDKYVTSNELAAYYSKGKSVAFYNHRCREKEQVYLQRFTPLRQSDELKFAKWKGIKFIRGTTRDYLFILQPHHVDKVTSAIENMMQSNWNRHFSALNL